MRPARLCERVGCLGDYSYVVGIWVGGCREILAIKLLLQACPRGGKCCARTRVSRLSTSLSSHQEFVRFKNLPIDFSLPFLPRVSEMHDDAKSSMEKQPFLADGEDESGEFRRREQKPRWHQHRMLLVHLVLILSYTSIFLLALRRITPSSPPPPPPPTTAVHREKLPPSRLPPPILHFTC